ncbi:Hypothetical predicted protein, partial [Paramuricea clavata]
RPHTISVRDVVRLGINACLDNRERTGGCWSERESQDHINILELRAAFFALKSFLPSQTNRHIPVRQLQSTNSSHS